VIDAALCGPDRCSDTKLSDAEVEVGADAVACIRDNLEPHRSEIRGRPGERHPGSAPTRAVETPPRDGAAPGLERDTVVGLGITDDHSHGPGQRVERVGDSGGTRRAETCGCRPRPIRLIEVDPDAGAPV